MQFRAKRKNTKNKAGSWVIGFLLLSPLIIGIINELREGKVFAEESLDNLVKGGITLSNFVVPSYHNPLINLFIGNYDLKVRLLDEFL